ncbi:serine/threonine-protein phosphatase 6 regulatory ankyrin repeat subunit A-like [Ornithodoros turicata]|uniref:serine/threonine-protein phosphatase 6 regulatory ankyrin repeat subunit A-like n=1 Tax=Ornithodoros turicata TaxID=34597 RepID=UPI003139169E
MSQLELELRNEGRFLIALFDNDLSTAKDLLSGVEGPPIDADIRIRVGGEFKPAICIAVERDLVQMVELLLKYNCSVNQSSSSGMSALHLAVARRNMATVQLLLRSRANVHCVDRDGLTPLHVAASHADCELNIIKSLVAAHGELEKCDRNKNTPLLTACYSNNVHIARYLIEKGANVNHANDRGDTPLHIVCSSSSPSLTLVEALLDAGAKVNVQNSLGLTPLLCAITMCSIQKSTVERLISQDQDMTVRFGPMRETVLHLAVQTSESATMALIACGCDPAVEDGVQRTPLEYALALNHPLLMWMLRACPTQGPSWKRLKDKALFYCRYGDVSARRIVEELRNVPRLTRVCRYALRKKYGCHADAVISNMQLPKPLQEFLLLKVA